MTNFQFYILISQLLVCTSFITNSLHNTFASISCICLAGLWLGLSWFEISNQRKKLKAEIAEIESQISRLTNYTK